MLNYFCELEGRHTFGGATTPLHVMESVWDWIEENWGVRPDCGLEGVIKITDSVSNAHGRIFFEYGHDVLKIWWTPMQAYQMAYDGINCFHELISDYKHKWPRDEDLQAAFVGV